VQKIISIVRQVASGLTPEQPNSLDDGLKGDTGRNTSPPIGAIAGWPSIGRRSACAFSQAMPETTL